MDLTNLQALLNDQKASSHSEWTSHQLAFRLLHTRQQHLTDGLGKDITTVRRVVFVMKGGVVYKNAARGAIQLR